VRTVANETRDWARAFVELDFGFDADVNRAVAALEEALARMAADPRVSRICWKHPSYLAGTSSAPGLTSYGCAAKVTAAKLGDVARVIRQYALEALDQASVSVSSPTYLGGVA